MPYVRPLTMRMSTANGTISLLDESRFYTNSTNESITAESSTQNDEHASGPDALANSGSPSWQNAISASFAQLAVQFQAASHNIATAIPPPPPTASSQYSTPEQNGPALLALTERLEAIEEEQRRLADAINALRNQFLSMNQMKTTDGPESIAPVPSGPSTADLEAIIKTQQEAFKLEQEQLPAKLQNALATKSLSPLKMPPMKNRKQPPNAPATRGEFEHLTKERYEALMQAYGVPISGDINNKRETLRSFLGIPSIPLEKK